MREDRREGPASEGPGGAPAPAVPEGGGEEVRCSWAVLRAVPHPHLGSSVNVAVVLHARTAEFIGLRAVTDEAWLRARVPDADVPLLARYLDSCGAIARGEEAAGPLALYPPSERFHWITAPRSDVLQPSPVREGRCRDPEAELEALFRRWVEEGPTEPGEEGSGEAAKPGEAQGQGG